MPIRTQHEFDGKLPAAVLYLDDLRRIVETMQEFVPPDYMARAQRSLLASDNTPQAQQELLRSMLHLKVRNTACDTIEELQQLGHTLHELQIKLGPYTLSLDKDRSELSGWGRNEELHGRLLPIFNSRKRLVQWMWGSSRNLYAVLGVLTGALMMSLLVASLVLFRLHHQVIGLAALVLAVCLFISGPKNLPHATIHLWRSHEATPQAVRWMPSRQTIVADIVKVLAGGVVGWLLAYFTKR
jgi:hypothetical protein